MKVKPLADRILVKRLEQDEVKQGGIIIPDTAKEKQMEARIIALGTGKLSEEGKKIDFAVKEGDTVLIGKYSGTEVTISGEEHLILKEEDILAKIE